MKIAFPRMGQLGILLKILFRQLGIDFAEPGENSTEALKRGCRYAPVFRSSSFSASLWKRRSRARIQPFFSAGRGPAGSDISER